MDRAEAGADVEVEVHADDLRIPERLIVAPVGGRFRMLPPEVITAEGEVVSVGQAIGVVERPTDEVPVLSRYQGFLMGMLALPGERVRPSQPVAWLRVIE
jgi:biotin carboxyl carrier protein